MKESDTETSFRHGMRSTEQEIVECVCRTIYAEAASLHARVAPVMAENDFGYRILYGPPILRPEILFIGYQPGGGARSLAEGLEEGQHAGWPVTCEYAHKKWLIAKRMREIWGEATLERCTGLNAVFFRAPSMKAWRRLPLHVRAELESFSRTQTERIVRTLKPKRLVVIGLETFARLATGTDDLRGDRAVLVRRGQLWDRPVFGMIHLSGARISRADLGRLKAYFAVEQPI